jgi:hypothetical protein
MLPHLVARRQFCWMNIRHLAIQINLSGEIDLPILLKAMALIFARAALSGDCSLEMCLG